MPCSRAKLGEVPHRYTASGYENADLCAWTFSSSTFAAGGGLANVRWNCPAAAAKAGCTSRYYLIQVTAGTSQPLEPDLIAVKGSAPSAILPGRARSVCFGRVSIHQGLHEGRVIHLCCSSVTGQGCACEKMVWSQKDACMSGFACF